MDKLSGSIYQRMLAVRKMAGLSQEDFARTVGTSRSIISQIEIGKIKPSYEVLIKTVNHFKLTYKYLLEGIGDPYEAATQVAEDAPPYSKTDTNGEVERLRSENSMLKDQVSALKDLTETQKILIERLK